MLLECTDNSLEVILRDNIIGRWISFFFQNKTFLKPRCGYQSALRKEPICVDIIKIASLQCTVMML